MTTTEEDQLTTVHSQQESINSKPVVTYLYDIPTASPRPTSVIAVDDLDQQLIKEAMGEFIRQNKPSLPQLNTITKKPDSVFEVYSPVQVIEEPNTENLFEQHFTETVPVSDFLHSNSQNGETKRPNHSSITFTSSPGPDVSPQRLTHGNSDSTTPTTTSRPAAPEALDDDFKFPDLTSLPPLTSVQVHEEPYTKVEGIQSGETVPTTNLPLTQEDSGGTGHHREQGSHFNTEDHPTHPHAQFVLVKIWNMVDGQLQLVGEQPVPVSMFTNSSIANGAVVNPQDLPPRVLASLASKMNNYPYLDPALYHPPRATRSLPSHHQEHHLQGSLDDDIDLGGLYQSLKNTVSGSLPARNSQPMTKTNTFHPSPNSQQLMYTTRGEHVKNRRKLKKLFDFDVGRPVLHTHNTGKSHHPTLKEQLHFGNSRQSRFTVNRPKKSSVSLGSIQRRSKRTAELLQALEGKVNSEAEPLVIHFILPQTTAQGPPNSHTAQGPPLSNTAQGPPLSHTAQEPPLSHTAQEPPLSHTAQGPPLSHTAHTSTTVDSQTQNHSYEVTEESTFYKTQVPPLPQLQPQPPPSQPQPPSLSLPPPPPQQTLPLIVSRRTSPPPPPPHEVGGVGSDNIHMSYPSYLTNFSPTPDQTHFSPTPDQTHFSPTPDQTYASSTHYDQTRTRPDPDSPPRRQYYGGIGNPDHNNLPFSIGTTLEEDDLTYLHVLSNFADRIENSPNPDPTIQAHVGDVLSAERPYSYSGNGGVQSNAFEYPAYAQVGDGVLQPLPQPNVPNEHRGSILELLPQDLPNISPLHPTEHPINNPVNLKSVLGSLPSHNTLRKEQLQSRLATITGTNTFSGHLGNQGFINHNNYAAQNSASGNYGKQPAFNQVVKRSNRPKPGYLTLISDLLDDSTYYPPGFDNDDVTPEATTLQPPNYTTSSVYDVSYPDYLNNDQRLPSTNQHASSLTPLSNPVNYPLPPFNDLNYPLLPSTNDLNYPLPFSTNDLNYPLPPSTNYLNYPLPPSTNDLNYPLPPSTNQVKYPITSSTNEANYPHIQSNSHGGYLRPPSTNDLNYPLPPSTSQVNYPRPLSNNQGNYQRLPPANHGNYQRLPPANQGSYQSLPPANQGNYQRLPPANQGSYQSLPPANQGSYQSLPPANQGNYQRLPPANQGNYQRLPPANQGSYQSLPPANQGNNQRLRPANQVNYQRLPLANQENYQRLPLANQENYQRLPLASQVNYPHRPSNQEDSELRPSTDQVRYIIRPSASQAHSPPSLLDQTVFSSQIDQVKLAHLFSTLPEHVDIPISPVLNPSIFSSQQSFQMLGFNQPPPSEPPTVDQSINNYYEFLQSTLPLQQPTNLDQGVFNPSYPYHPALSSVVFDDLPNNDETITPAPAVIAPVAAIVPVPATATVTNVQTCLSDNTCALGIAALLALGISKAIALPFLVPALIGRRRRHLHYLSSLINTSKKVMADEKQIEIWLKNLTTSSNSTTESSRDVFTVAYSFISDIANISPGTNLSQVAQQKTTKKKIEELENTLKTLTKDEVIYLMQRALRILLGTATTHTREGDKKVTHSGNTKEDLRNSNTAEDLETPRPLTSRRENVLQQ
ncbi:uncharacterized protein LOC121871904 isoform X2 [Homarus americanus]|uniref:uncharacterized protein LOC121871904 isoform X2 n=1 Tax=Homarus americanus TaxID=6706 RepID=UPI001C467654|nr:uncharacterized protein LOC121871904 isoform X2 [Homarus americanus]